MHITTDSRRGSSSDEASISRLPTVTCEAPSSDAEDHERHTHLLFKPTTKSRPNRSLEQILDNKYLKSEQGNQKSRQQKFHRQFQELPASELLIDYFSCALITDVILQGHLYITSEHFAFHSNMSEFVTKLIIPITSVTNITKERTAYVIPNAIAVITKSRKHVFGTLLSRDATHKILTHVWRNRNNQNANGVPYKADARMDRNVKSKENDPITTMENDDFDDKLSDDVDDDYIDDDSSISESRCSSRTEYSYELKNFKLSPIPIKKGKSATLSSLSKVETKDTFSQTTEPPTYNWIQYLKQVSSNDLWLLGSTIMLIMLFSSAGVLLHRLSVLQHEYAAVMHEPLLNNR
ncbi:hypothetical protein LSTR_LSTR010178 [Laodelphax striatellus]|uniref:GRAM domain-containing protein n=1 Tax=Laodelphax striatellus TaxID=195883 RepID=A0A482XKG2_LAOST|nr:hypothetical protein LSTR_LSTR010178 [Laodelphax striatellus]